MYVINVNMYEAVKLIYTNIINKMSNIDKTILSLWFD